MVMLCDACKEDVTTSPEAEFPTYEMVNIQSTQFCFCLDCVEALGNFLTSDAWKEVVSKHKAEMKKLEKE